MQMVVIWECGYMWEYECKCNILNSFVSNYIFVFFLFFFQGPPGPTGPQGPIGAPGPAVSIIHQSSLAYSLKSFTFHVFIMLYVNQNTFVNRLCHTNMFVTISA